MFELIKRLFSTESTEVRQQKKATFEKIYADLQPKINSYAVDCIEMKAGVDENLNLSNSKFGGVPCFPLDEEYPRDEKGKPMRLLVQINFAEVPYLPPYPDAGLLQIYISEKEGGMYGLDLYNQPTLQDNWRVLWFENTDFEPRKNLGNLFTKKWNYSPFMKALLRLNFSLKKDIPSYPSMEYSEFIEPLFEGEFEDDLSDEFLDQELNEGHKIGGFPYFTQSEIRDWKPEFKDYKLLLQIDSDRKNKINWGDGGVANFFIKPEDLEKRDFSKVLYNWDCH